MYTQCPECLTIYEIDEDALQASLGIVHCGRCDKRFDALRTLSDSLPEAPLTPLPERDPAERAPTLTTAVPPAAYESVARKRRSPRGAAGANQHEPGRAPSATADPANPGMAPTEPVADDWFAQIESELTDAPLAPPALAGIEHADGPPIATGNREPVNDATGNAHNGTVGGAAKDTMASAGDIPDHAAAVVAPTGGVDGGVQESETPDIDDYARMQEPEALPDDVTVFASVTLASEPAQAPRAADAVSDAAMPPTAVPAVVVSPRLLEGNVFGARIDTPVPTAAAPDAIDLNRPVADTPDATGTDTPAASASDESEPDSDAAQSPVPIYVRPRGHFVAASWLTWSASCLLLALVLAVQLAWANRVELVRNPATRAWTQRICTNIPCRLPPIKDVAQLELLSRDVRPDPNAADALTITATVRNDATFRQPWPVVVVELTDFDNHTVAMRRFRPAEYMPDPSRRAAGIAPGATAALAFEVADPGKRAGGYRFSFD